MKPLSPALLGVLMVCFLGAFGITIWTLREPPMPDFGSLPVSAKKQQFFDFLRPHIRAANADIRSDRERLETIALNITKTPAAATPNWRERRLLHRLADAYDIELADPVDYAKLVDRLLTRVDTVPEALMLVQAAKESAWGTSKFATQGNNFFGQQCFVRGCGFVPTARDKGRKHEVARFDTVEHAVVAYLHNLNTHYRYAGMRRIRAQLRDTSQQLSGKKLADGLLAYSERREAYVKEVKAMIRQNRLE